MSATDGEGSQRSLSRPYRFTQLPEQWGFHPFLGSSQQLLEQKLTIKEEKSVTQLLEDGVGEEKIKGLRHCYSEHSWKQTGPRVGHLQCPPLVRPAVLDPRLPLHPEEQGFSYFLILSSSSLFYLPFFFFLGIMFLIKRCLWHFFPCSHQKDGVSSVPACLLVSPGRSLAVFTLLIAWRTLVQVHVRLEGSRQWGRVCAPEIPVSS